MSKEEERRKRKQHIPFLFLKGVDKSQLLKRLLQAEKEENLGQMSKGCHRRGKTEGGGDNSRFD